MQTEEMIDILLDEYCKIILTAVSSGAVKVDRLTDEFDMSSATAYRRIEQLLEHDLITGQTNIDEYGNQYREYESNFDSIKFEIINGRSYVQILREDDHELIEICNAN